MLLYLYSGVDAYKLSVSHMRRVPDASFHVPFHGTSYSCKGDESDMTECPYIRVATNCVTRRDEVTLACAPHSLPANYTAGKLTTM